MMDLTFSNKKILIIGGTGSLGKKFIERLGKKNHLFILGRDEMKAWTIENAIRDQKLNVEFFTGDVRDKNRLNEIFKIINPHVVIHAAALKRIELAEKFPTETIATNITGTQNIIDVIRDGVLNNSLSCLEKFLYISSDKATNSISLYGASKFISERLTTSISQYPELSKVKFLATRYGNVFGSRGSLLILLKFQAENKKEFTLTNPEMTRFLMTLDEAVDLNIKILNEGSSGELWVPKIPSIKILDLFELFSEKYNKPFKVIGERQIEKLHEDMISETESTHASFDDKNQVFVIQPSYKQLSHSRFSYSSDQHPISKQELSSLLEKLEIFEKKIDDFPSLSIEEIAK